MGAAEFDDPRFGPETLAARFFRNKSAMAAITRCFDLDLGVLPQPGGLEGAEWDHRIVLGYEQQRGHANLA